MRCGNNSKANGSRRPVTPRERDDEEMENIECAAFSVWEEQREGRTAAASTPVWMGSLEYWLIDGTSVEGNDGLLARLPTAASLKLPFILKGGSDMQIAFETKKIVDTQMQMRVKHLVRAQALAPGQDRAWRLHWASGARVQRAQLGYRLAAVACPAGGRQSGRRDARRDQRAEAAG